MCSIRIGIAAMTVLLGACSASLPTTQFDGLHKPEPAAVPGYLAPASLLDGAALIPPPPVAGTPAQAADDAAFLASHRLRGTPRWDVARRDAEFRFPKPTEAFWCALGMEVSAETTPHLYVLLRRSYVDAAAIAFRSKAPHARKRPFVAGNDPICTPELAAPMRTDTSYPATSAAVGWAWALVLAEVAPARTDAILRRGYEIGESRAVCGVHWESDVSAARTVGAAVVAQLHANADFRAQLAAARGEVDRTLASGATVGLDCAAEARALGR